MPIPSQIKDPSLAPQGLNNLALAEEKMGALMKVRERFSKERPFEGLRIGLALHITKETGVLVRTLKDGGAQVAITGCNPLSTQDDVAAALAQEDDVLVYGHKGESLEDYDRFLEAVLAFRPNVIIDDGCDLITALVTKHRDLLPEVIGGCEETTTGIHRLRAIEKDGALPFPMIAVNDNLTKHLMDNVYGTGQSTLDGILRATNVMLAGKTLVVAGYGSCGKGVAMRARGMGARVLVTEVNPFKALQAHMDGYQVLPMEEAATLGDVFVTVTGNVHVITLEHLRSMKSGAIVCNSGHFDVEIDVKALSLAATKIEDVRPSMQRFTLTNAHGKTHHVYILGEGRLVNLAAAEGHPSEVMSLSFCGQALACEYLIQNQKELQAGVHTLPEALDMDIAQLYLTAEGLKIDSLRPDQLAYLQGWQ